APVTQVLCDPVVLSVAGTSRLQNAEGRLHATPDQRAAPCELARPLVAFEVFLEAPPRISRRSDVAHSAGGRLAQRVDADDLPRLDAEAAHETAPFRRARSVRRAFAMSASAIASALVRSGAGAGAWMNATMSERRARPSAVPR